MARDNRQTYEEVDTSLFIPPNFTDSGKILNTFKTRNFIEAVIFAGAPTYALWTFFFESLGMITCLMITIFVFVPILVFCIIGVNDDSLTTFLGHIISFLKNRKKMRFKRIKPKKEISYIRGNEGASGRKVRKRGNTR